MINKHCPICGEVKYRVVYKSNLPEDHGQVNYDGRKKPDNYHYEMVRCSRCGLLFASSIYDDELVEKLYENSDFTYETEVKGLRQTYQKCLDKSHKYIDKRGSILDIGCGNGFMLEVALTYGWSNVIGIEPSKLAVEKAKPKLRKIIIQKIFNKNDFTNGSIDLVFCAMVLEHLSDINDFLQGVFNILKPGGILLAITHDESHFLSKILKNKHPIINDEHAYVFSSKTIQNIFQKNNFIIRETNKLNNIYTIKYWLTMIPLFKGFINFMIKKLVKIRLLDISIGLKAGNIYIIAQKPYKEAGK